MSKPYRLDLPLLALLAQCDVWVIPRPEAEKFPIVLAFYVPAALAAAFSRSLRPHQPHPPGHPDHPEGSCPAGPHLVK